MNSKTDEVIAMTVKAAQQEPDISIDIDAAKPPIPVIEGIHSRKDGTYVVTLDGYPYHATLNETPQVFQLVLEMIKDGAEVTDYVEPEIVRPSPAEVALDEYNRLRAIVDFEIAPLQDAIDDGTATDSEVSAHSAWRTYRIALNRVRGQSGYPLNIEWPVAPV